jgi:hypothetical protein
VHFALVPRCNPARNKQHGAPIVARTYGLLGLTPSACQSSPCFTIRYSFIAASVPRKTCGRAARFTRPPSPLRASIHDVVRPRWISRARANPSLFDGGFLTAARASLPAADLKRQVPAHHDICRRCSVQPTLSEWPEGELPRSRSGVHKWHSPLDWLPAIAVLLCPVL